MKAGTASIKKSWDAGSRIQSSFLIWNNGKSFSILQWYPEAVYVQPSLFVCFVDAKKREELSSVKEEIVVFSLQTDW